jgi:hypothetical protein
MCPTLDPPTGSFSVVDTGMVRKVESCCLNRVLPETLFRLDANELR